jgi:hypothetical protein
LSRNGPAAPPRRSAPAQDRHALPSGDATPRALDVFVSADLDVIAADHFHDLPGRAPAVVHQDAFALAKLSHGRLAPERLPQAGGGCAQANRQNDRDRHDPGHRHDRGPLVDVREDYGCGETRRKTVRKRWTAFISDYQHAAPDVVSYQFTMEQGPMTPFMPNAPQGSQTPTALRTDLLLVALLIGLGVGARLLPITSNRWPCWCRWPRWR